MIEIEGNIWDYRLPNHVIMVTTNGSVNKNGACVMGVGVALQAKWFWPHLAKQLGDYIKEHKNEVVIFSRSVGAFPVKHNWWELADLSLIKQSTSELLSIAEDLAYLTFILPRPGCGAGRRHWTEVEPIVRRLPDNVHIIHLPGEA